MSSLWINFESYSNNGACECLDSFCMAIACPLNKSGQPIGQSGQTFKRWLGTFCLCQALCPLVPVNWTHVPNHFKENAWDKIQVVTY